jgi:hypothetical protein
MHVFYTIDSQLAVRLSVSLACRALPYDEVNWYSFLLEAESTPGPSAAGRTRSSEKSSHVGNRARHLPACSVVPQGTHYRVPTVYSVIYKVINNSRTYAILRRRVDPR